MIDLATMAGFLATQDHKSVLSDIWTAPYP